MDTPTTSSKPVNRLTKRRRSKFATSRTILALMLREMSTRYGRTPGGYLWTILGPFSAILFLSIGFSLVIRKPAIGTSFLLFYATGYMFFLLFQDVSATTSRALNFSKSLLKYPAVTWIDAILARFFLNGMTTILTTILLIGAILIYLEQSLNIDMVPVLIATFLGLLLGLGVGTLNCALMGLFPLWDVTWSILTRPLFLASGILYTYDSLPTLAREILWYNPLIHITGLTRSAFYPTYRPDYVSIIYVLFFGLICLAFGLLLMKRYHRVILNK